MLAGFACALLIQSSIEAKITELISQMTLEEKVGMLAGHDGMYTHGVPRLGIPDMFFSDGPAGVRTKEPTPSYAAPICLAASWNMELAKKVGASFARDARARGVNVMLAPAVNIYRVPVNGRNFEYLGEDPFLAGKTAVGYIQGLQAAGVGATVKHFAANNQEFERTTISSRVDERTLRELYLPAFEMAVKEGKVWAVMSSYNRLNGTYASENDWLLNRVLKGEWGFQGMVMSDWGAVHSSLPTALAGMDLEMPGGPFFLPETLLPLVHSGQLTAGILDDKIRRILRVEFWTEAIDGTKVSGPLNSPESDEIATEEARQGMVLLKNDKQLLPIRSNVKSIAIIGPNAEPAVVGGGGSAHTRPESSISLLQAIKDRAGSSVKVRFARAANPTIGQIVKESKFTQPIRATYFSNRQLQGAPVLVREESLISHDFSRDEQVPRSDFSARWSTTITVPVSGDYEFVAQGDDGFRVALDQRQIIDEWRDQASTSARKIVHLQAGRNYAFRAEYYQAGGDATFSVGFRRVDPDRFKEIEAAAKASDLAIVSVGLNASLESEGFDHAYSLPDDEDQMILAALRGNKQVLVIYNGGGAVDMNAWRDKVPGLLFAWYPGQSGNKALAQILFGDVSPSGKLPISVERRFSDLPAYKNYPGKGGEVVYAEGLKVGYRFFDQAPVKPAFPFGFGLSYSTFEYSNLRVSSRQATFTIKNTGRMKAAEIAQLYVQPPKGSVWRPVKELKGFARVDLRPGDSRTLSIPLDDRAFAYWDIAKHRWTVEPGTYKILIGSSSVDMKLIGELKIN